MTILERNPFLKVNSGKDISKNDNSEKITSEKDNTEEKI